MNKKIMIVENESLIALAISEKLEQMGYSIVKIVSSGKKAITYLEKNEKPDVLLMDVGIDGVIDGIALTKIVNDSFDIPVIYMTAFQDKETLERMNKTKYIGHFIKGMFDDKEIGLKLEDYFSHSIRSNEGD